VSHTGTGTKENILVNNKKIEIMGLKRGMTNNRKGRPAGSLNKSSDQLRNIFQAFLETNLETMQRDFDNLESKDRLSFIERIAKMIIPPPLTLDKLTDSQLDQIITGITFDDSE